MAESANLLRHETSPYLLQHADNPVHWRPWGHAALAEAREAGKPILLSIGYAACHWCHVMAHESFENAETAAAMNRLFVNIKVDREERPDIDHIYMSALQTLGQQGGWPLTMFLTSDAAPFWGGTYFPPEPRFGRPSFAQVLQAVAEAYRSGHEMVAQNSAAIGAALASLSASRPGGRLTGDDLDRAGAALLAMTDPVQGGLRGAPKFPNPPIFRFLFQESFRTGQPGGAEALHLMLRRMSQGGIYDHLGGGYARYATDAVWLVPHFEKMLYDNAQLLELLALAHVNQPSDLYARRAAETVIWMDRDMTAARLQSGEAAFAASEDADSEGVEGKFYVWSEPEIDALLGPEAVAFKTAYDVTPDGNWEGHTILNRQTPFGADEEEAALAKDRATLFDARARRIRPARDDKVLADWNGLAIAALCRAAAVFNRPEWLDRAASAFDFIIARMSTPDGRVQHAWRLDRGTAAGLLEDQAAMARAALALYEHSGEMRRLQEAIRLVEAAAAYFGDSKGGFFTTASDATDLPLGEAARPRSTGDNATPAGSGLMAEVFARLFHLTGDPAWRDRCEALAATLSGYQKQLSAFPTLLGALDFLESGASVVIAGPAKDPRTQALLSVALSAPDPAVAVLRASALDLVPPGHPAHGKSTVGDAPAAYVCRNATCGLPLTDLVALDNKLRRR